MSEALQRECEALRAQVSSLREQCEAAEERAMRALAKNQQQTLAMQLIRQKNEDLDRLAAELDQAKRSEATRAQELATTNDQLLARERENHTLIERLRELITQLSTPVLQVGPDVLALPIIGVIDEQRAVALTSRALEQIEARRARYIVLDLTGVETIDANTVEHLLRLLRAAALLGAKCVVCGLQPAIVRTIITLGVEIHGITAAGDLHEALAMIARMSQQSAVSQPA